MMNQERRIVTDNLYAPPKSKLADIGHDEVSPFSGAWRSSDSSFSFFLSLSSRQLSNAGSNN